MNTPSVDVQPQGSQPGSRTRVRVPWWRRQYMVNRDMQIKFAGSAVLIGMSSSMVSAGMLLWSFWVFNIWQGQRLPLPILVVIAVVMFFNILGIYVSALVATSRIAGPLFNLLRQFSRLSRGDFSTHAKFRESDEIHYVARRFNEMVESLASRDEEIFLRVDEAEQALRDKNFERVGECLAFLNSYREREREALNKISY